MDASEITWEDSPPSSLGYEPPRSLQEDPELQRERMWAFGLGLVSLVLGGLVLGPLAIYRARRVLARGGDGLAVAAIALGVLGILSSLGLWLFLAIWQYLAPAVR